MLPVSGRIPCSCIYLKIGPMADPDRMAKAIEIHTRKVTWCRMKNAPIGFTHPYRRLQQNHDDGENEDEGEDEDDDDGVVGFSLLGVSLLPSLRLLLISATLSSSMLFAPVTPLSWFIG